MSNQKETLPGESNCETQCGDCCKFMLIPIGDEPSDFTRWAELHENIKLTEWRGLICVELPFKCTKLKNNKCTIYDKRPDICKQFKCDKLK